MLILIGDRILLANLDFQSRNAKITRFWNRVYSIRHFADVYKCRTYLPICPLLLIKGKMDF